MYFLFQKSVLLLDILFDAVVLLKLLKSLCMIALGQKQLVKRVSCNIHVDVFFFILLTISKSITWNEIISVVSLKVMQLNADFASYYKNSFYRTYLLLS